MLTATDAQALRRLIPLNALPAPRFEQLCAELRVEDAPKGQALFHQGDAAGELVYVLDGTVSLQAGGVEMDSISGGTPAARFAVAHQNPRKVSAVAKEAVRFVRVEPETASIRRDEPHREMPAHSAGKPSGEIETEWTARLVDSPLFQRLPPANRRALLRSLEEIRVRKGDEICRQDEPGDYYYIIKSGKCGLTRRPSRLSKEVKLATLRAYDAFGEDSLISGEPRNVTVTMLTDGVLLRLDKASFLKLIKEPTVARIDWEAAEQLSGGAAWLDVRQSDAYEQGHLPGSFNIPFFSLRMMLPTLDRNRRYVLVCDTGRLSEAAAFLLIRQDFKADALIGGIDGIPGDRLVAGASESFQHSSLTCDDKAGGPLAAESVNGTNIPFAEPETAASGDGPKTVESRLRGMSEILKRKWAVLAASLSSLSHGPRERRALVPGLARILAAALLLTILILAGLLIPDTGRELLRQWLADGNEQR
jgi:CRP-like cAMP-binding protein